MKKEKSCGAVIYRYQNNELYILLVKHNAGHYSFPKGHVENNETEEETAIREVKEETGLDISIINRYRSVITYSPKENTVKDVIFFLAKPLNETITPQLSEVQEVSWYNIKDAENKITYQEDKKVLKSSIKFISNF